MQQFSWQRNVLKIYMCAVCISFGFYLFTYVYGMPRVIKSFLYRYPGVAAWLGYRKLPPVGHYVSMPTRKLRHYLQNTDLCQSKEIFLLIYVLSPMSAFNERRVIRQTCGSVIQLYIRPTIIFFVVRLKAALDQKLQAQLELVDKLTSLLQSKISYKTIEVWMP